MNEFILAITVGALALGLTIGASVAYKDVWTECNNFQQTEFGGRVYDCKVRASDNEQNQTRQ